jgi:hypothetical protein
MIVLDNFVRVLMLMNEGGLKQMLRHIEIGRIGCIEQDDLLNEIELVWVWVLELE